MYDVEALLSLISSVTDAVAEEVKSWQARSLDAIYLIVYLDCINVKVREGAVRAKAVYLAIGITMNSDNEVLGLLPAQTEGAKFWLQVVPSSATGTFRTFLSPALMGSRASPTPLRQCSLRRCCGCASCIWFCVTA